MKKTFITMFIILCTAQSVHAWYDADRRKLDFYRHSIEQIQKVMKVYAAQLPSADARRAQALNNAISNLSRTMKKFTKKIATL